MLYLKNGFGVSLSFDNKQYPLTDLTFISISICERVSIGLPTVEILLKDINTALFDKVELGDGTLIHIVLENNNIRDSMLFVCTGYRSNDKDTTVLISGILNYPMMLKHSPIFHKGTSSDAIKAIGAACGFTNIIVDPTTDTQAWLPSLDTALARIDKIVEVSYKGNSFYRRAITSIGELLFLDINKAITSKALSIALSKSDSGAYPATGGYVESLHGTLNNWKGYGNRITNVALDKTVSALSTTDVTKMGGFLNLSNTVGQIGFTTMGCGNTHPNYEKAIQGNLRNLALYSINAHCVVKTLLPEVRLLAPVDMYYDSRHTGRYVISGRSRFIGGTGYYEKLELCTNSFAINTTRKLL